MINITVHHHHNPHFACLQAPACGAPANIATRQQHKQQTTTSSVEVHYSGPPLRQNNHGIAHRLTAETDLNNNTCDNNDENINLKSKETSVESETSSRQYSKTDQDIEKKRTQSKNLHTRSISLIVNPEFSSDSESELALSRRRSLPRLLRRTRLLLATEAAQNQHHPMNCEEIHSDGSLDDQISRAQLDLQVPETTLTTAQVSHTTISATELAALEQAESCARLRETGAFLRQISDEFSK